MPSRILEIVRGGTVTVKDIVRALPVEQSEAVRAVEKLVENGNIAVGEDGIVRIIR